MPQNSEIFTPEVDKEIFEMYTIKGMSLKAIAEQMGIKLSTMYSYSYRKELSKKRTEFKNKLSVQLFEDRSRDLVKTFADSIETTQILINHFNIKVKKHNNAGTVAEMIEALSPKEFQVLKLAVELNNKHIMTRATVDQFKQTSSVGGSNKTEIVFNDGYTPEMLNDDRFKVEESMQMLEETVEDTSLPIDVQSDMIVTNAESTQDDLKGIELDGQSKD